ncbi:MAG TPA: hypothetical protein VLJ79_23750 [Candidatus Binatia bacterium]|nr:hypothetical protein [Candidatus Binatia bacterium]
MPKLSLAKLERHLYSAADRLRQEVRKVGFWKNQSMRELLTRTLVRDLDKAGICAGTERDLTQKLVALAKENHENLTR